jgi:uncharacterized membrane protein YbhN (UPF0104 family)
VSSMTASPVAAVDEAPLPVGQDLELRGPSAASHGSLSPPVSTLKVVPARRWRRTRVVLKVVAALAVLVLLASERSLIASSLRIVGHLKWSWFVLAVALESMSMASFAQMQRRLLRVGATRVRLFPVMATVYAGNALSTTVPFAGPQMSTVFVFRRFKKLDVDATVAGWTLVVAGVISSLASALLLAAGAILTGNDVAIATGIAGGLLGVGIFALTTAALRRPAVTTALRRPAGWVLLQASRVLRRPARDWDEVLINLTSRLGSLRLPVSGWVTVVMGAFLNWLADFGVPRRQRRSRRGSCAAAGPSLRLRGGCGSPKRRSPTGRPRRGGRRSRRRPHERPGAPSAGLGCRTCLPLHQLLDGHLSGLAHLSLRGQTTGRRQPGPAPRWSSSRPASWQHAVSSSRAVQRLAVLWLSPLCGPRMVLFPLGSHNVWAIFNADHFQRRPLSR